MLYLLAASGQLSPIVAMQAVFLLVLAGQGLTAWGISPSSPLRPEALTYLQIRAIGSPAAVIFLVAQAR